VLTTKEAIEKRRSIRKYKTDPVPDEHIMELLESARLAPSGSNAQPWRFKVVKDEMTRMKLAEAAYGQSFISTAPVVIVCCADIKSYLEETVSHIQDLGRNGAIEQRIVNLLVERTEKARLKDKEEIAPRIAFNVAIAVEHIVLRASPVISTLAHVG